jgi:hypothetical protein
VRDVCGGEGSERRIGSVRRREGEVGTGRAIEDFLNGKRAHAGRASESSFRAFFERLVGAGGLWWAGGRVVSRGRVCGRARGVTL